MKIFSPVFLNLLTVFGWATWGRASVPAPALGHFELLVVAREPGADIVELATSGSDRTFLVQSKAVLSSTDLSLVKAVTTRSWSVLSGGHRTSQLVLKLKPEAAIRFRESVRNAISAGNGIALVLNREVLGVLMLSHPFDGVELNIDASFFSQGTEDQKTTATQTLARRIKATLP